MMQGKIYDWSNKYIGNDSSRKKLIVISLLLLLVVCGTGGGLYYHQYKNQKQAEEEKARRLATTQRQIQNIKKYYQTSLAGVSPDQFIAFMSAIYESRKPLELSGLRETALSCDAQKCSFSYTRDGLIFSTQNKIFRGETYSPSFTEDRLEYTNIPSGFESGLLLARFTQQKPIQAYDCNDVLNYVYSFNSGMPQDKKFILSSLPASTVTTDETAQPQLAESYKLLFAPWSVTLPDNYVDVATFWSRHSFLEFFIINSVVKADTNPANLLTVKGVFLCKK